MRSASGFGSAFAFGFGETGCRSTAVSSASHSARQSSRKRRGTRREATRTNRIARVSDGRLRILAFAFDRPQQALAGLGHGLRALLRVERDGLAAPGELVIAARRPLLA